MFYACTMQLNKVGLRSEAERRLEALRTTQSHKHLNNICDSPSSTRERTKKREKQRGGLFKLFTKRKTAAKKGGKERERDAEEENKDSEEGEEGRSEVGQSEDESESFLTASVSMPNIACELSYTNIVVAV